MGTVTPYVTGAGRRWRVRYRTPDHRQTDKRGFKTKRDAELYLANVEVSKAAGSYVDPQASRITVGELAVDWLANKRQAMKPSSFHSIDTSWRVYVEPRWSTAAVGSIRPSAVEQWIRELGEGSAVAKPRVRWTGDESRPRSATVVLRALGVLAGILDVAVKDGRVAKNVARTADGTPRKHSNKTRRYLSHEEVIRFAEAAETDVQATLLMTLAYCGLRWGEATGLRVRDVAMLRRRLQVNRTATEVNGDVVEGWQTPRHCSCRRTPRLF